MLAPVLLGFFTKERGAGLNVGQVFNLPNGWQWQVKNLLHFDYFYFCGEAYVN